MTTATQTLTEFLLARIAEDEAAARAVADENVGGAAVPLHVGDNAWDSEWPYADRYTPARVLAECEAKRRILAALDRTACPCQTASRCVIHDASAGPIEFARERYLDPVTEITLHSLAAVYSDHPDYRDEWRP